MSKRPYPGRVRREKRKDEALRLHDEGKSYARIAAALGVSRTEAFRLVKDGKLEVGINPEEVLARRSAQVGQIEEVLSAMLPKAGQGDTDASREARGWFAHLIELTGTAAPQRTEFSGPNGSPIQLDHDAGARILGKLAGLVAQPGGDPGKPDGGGAAPA